MKLLLFLIAFCASSSAFADFVCTYTDSYTLNDDGSMKRALALRVGEKFTMTLDGKSGGKIQGDFTVHDDGRRPGFAWKAVRGPTSSQKLRMALDPERYQAEQAQRLRQRVSDIPETLIISTFTETATKPFMLVWQLSVYTGLCEML